MTKTVFLLILAFSAVALQPNIIFVMADDLGYADLGSYGQQSIQTPHLDKMAAEGARFTDCYSGAPVCAPARSTLMTGQHTGHTTVRGNSGKGGVKGLGGGNGRVPLSAEDNCVAQTLKDAGYVTGMTGKWGIGEPGTTGEPGKKGWDEFYGYLNQRRAHSYYPDYIWHGTKKIMLPGNANRKKEQYTHDMFAAFALDFVRRHAVNVNDAKQRKPFFLYLPYLIPHEKYEIPSVEPYADTPWQKDEKVHAAMITRLDEDMGDLLALLKELGIDDNTIVFFTSDNGAAKRWEGRFDSSGPLSGHKRDLSEGGTRVPMIVRWPGEIQAGSVRNDPWWFPDVLPTCAALAGTPSPANVDGLNVLPMLLGQAQDLHSRRLYWEFYEGGFKQAARMGDWKVIRHRNEPTQLYNLANDLAEKRNLAKAHPQRVQEFESFFAASRKNSRHWPSPVDSND
jgi:arylsulfatase A-like enzyme